MKEESKLYSYKLIFPALALYILLFILPTITGFYYSMTDWSPQKDVITFTWFENFKYIFNDDVLKLAITNTFMYAIIVVIFKNGLGLIMALALNVKMASKNFFRAIFYMPCIVSTIVIGLIFIPILQPDGILNSFLNSTGLGFMAKYWLSDTKTVVLAIAGVSIWQWSGYHMSIYLAGLQTISEDYYEAAKIDGANAIHKFRYITLPLLAPSININIILSLIGGLRVFSEVYALTNGGPGNASQVLTTSVLTLFGEGRWGLATALNTLLFLIISIIAIPLLRKMRQLEVEE